MKKCYCCHKEISKERNIRYCDDCGTKRFGERMFKEMVKDFEKTKNI